MKKLICLLLSIIMIVITFTGCTYYDDSTDESTEEYTYEETTEEETTETTTEPTTRQLDINFSAPNKMYVGNGMILKGVSQHTTIDDDNNITIELTVKCVSGFTDDGCPYFGYFLYYLYGKNNTLLDYTSIGTSDPLYGNITIIIVKHKSRNILVSAFLHFYTLLHRIYHLESYAGQGKP